VNSQHLNLSNIRPRELQEATFVDEHCSVGGGRVLGTFVSRNRRGGNSTWEVGNREPNYQPLIHSGDQGSVGAEIATAKTIQSAGLCSRPKDLILLLVLHVRNVVIF